MNSFNSFLAVLKPIIVISPFVIEIFNFFFRKQGGIISDKRISSLNNMSPRLFRAITVAIFLAITYLLFYPSYIIATCLYFIFSGNIERLIIYLNKDENAKRILEMTHPPLPPAVHKALVVALIIAILLLLWIW